MAGHYANAFEVVGPDGEVLKRRVLRHPHIDEQPSTRHTPSVHVPANVERVTVGAGDKAHGWGRKTISVEVPRPDAAEEPEKKPDPPRPLPRREEQEERP